MCYVFSSPQKKILTDGLIDWYFKYRIFFYFSPIQSSPKVSFALGINNSKILVPVDALCIF